MLELIPQGHDAIDAFEEKISGLSRLSPPTEHHFWGGFYIRKIVMPAGFSCSTKIHGKRHPFFISRGVVEVVNQMGEVQTFTAPYVGITEPGTRRALYVKEECEWTTFHSTDAESVEEAERDLILHRPSPSGLEYANARNEQPERLEIPNAD